MKSKVKFLLAMLCVLLVIPTITMAEVPLDGDSATSLLINNEPVNLDLKCTDEGSGDDIATKCELSQPVQTNDYQISSFWVTYKEDPFITYGLAVMDTGAPSTFGFSFSQPIVPVAGNNVVKSSMSYSTTDGAASVPFDGVTVTAMPPVAGIPVDADGIPEIQVTTVYDGTSRANFGLDIGPSAIYPNPPQSSSSLPFNVGPIAGPVSASVTGWTTLQIDVNFQMSGGGDILTMNGRSDINPQTDAPEFPSIFIPAVAIIGMMCIVTLLRIKK